MPSKLVLDDKHKPYRFSSGFFEQATPVSYFDLLKNFKDQGFDSNGADTTINEIFNNTTVFNENLPNIISGHDLVLPDGLITLPALRWVNDLTDGLYRVGSHDQAYVINGVVRTGWDSNGFRINISSSTTFPALDINQASTGDAGVRIRLASARSLHLGYDNDDNDKIKLSISADGGAVAGMNDILEIPPSGHFVFQPLDSSDNDHPTFEFVGPFLTLLTASIEHIDFYVATGRVIQWLAGNLTTQRNMYVEAPTYAFSGGSTITNAASLAVEGAPIAGTNATITNRYGIWLQSDDLRVGGNLVWDSGTSFPTVMDHANTAGRTYSFQDRNGTVAFLDDVSAARGAHLLNDSVADGDTYLIAGALSGTTSPATSQGSTSIPGVDGQEGADGLDAVPGVPGLQGERGASHWVIEDGERGEEGYAGSRGIDGIIGINGAPGNDGESGEDGPPGPPGRDGTIGVNGATGSQGPAGPATFLEAEPGDDGMVGPPGMTGPAGAGGGASATTVEANIATGARWRGKFTITDAAITSAKKVLVWQAPGPYTGKGTRADEAELQPVNVIAVEPLTGTATVYWETPPMVIEVRETPLAPNYGNGTAANTGLNRDERTTAIRLGKVRGNVKFSYMVLA